MSDEEMIKTPGTVPGLVYFERLADRDSEIDFGYAVIASGFEPDSVPEAIVNAARIYAIENELRYVRVVPEHDLCADLLDVYASESDGLAALRQRAVAIERGSLSASSRRNFDEAVADLDDAIKAHRTN